MKLLLILLLVVCYVMALPNREERKLPQVNCPSCKDPDRDDDDWHPSDDDDDDDDDDDECGCDIDCEDPCDDCSRVEFHNQTSTPVLDQLITDHTILECAPGSYFQRIEFDGTYIWGTTCTGVLTGRQEDVELYTGVRVDKDGKETRHELNAEWYRWVTNFVNGNALQTESAKLERCGRCSGDILRSNSQWNAIDRLTGCCGIGVNHIQASNFRLNIYGECCSECYLVQSSLSYPKAVKNANVY